MVKLFCINLETRKDRLDRFIRLNKDKLGQEIEVIKAINGKTINLENVSDKINPLDYLTVKNNLPGVYGCCSSHFKIFRKMITENIEYAIIMEDDLLLEENLSKVLPLINNFKGDLLYFNYPYPKESYVKTNTKGYQLKPFDGKLHTAEMYLISKSFAQKVLNYFENNIGAFDLMLKRTIMRERCIVMCLEPPIADQFDRNDSNIR